ncbi:Uncharacterised protein [Collinsella intestinalis]|nr:Uncharacterised protein [Collinsella intestinalis]
MLDDRGDSGHGHRVGAGNVGGHGVLEGHAKLGVTGGDQGIGAVLGSLDDFDLEAGLLVVTTLGCDIYASVVRVGGPVQGEGDLAQLGIARCGGPGRLFGTAAAAERRGTDQPGACSTSAQQRTARQHTTGHHGGHRVLMHGYLLF